MLNLSLLRFAAIAFAQTQPKHKEVISTIFLKMPHHLNSAEQSYLSLALTILLKFQENTLSVLCSMLMNCNIPVFFRTHPHLRKPMN